MEKESPPGVGDGVRVGATGVFVGDPGGTVGVTVGGMAVGVLVGVWVGMTGVFVGVPGTVVGDTVLVGVASGGVGVGETAGVCEARGVGVHVGRKVGVGWGCVWPWKLPQISTSSK